MTEEKRAFQRIQYQDGFQVMQYLLYDYDPTTEYVEDLSREYLLEDMVSLLYISKDITVDLGWYGNHATNNGVFKIHIIQSIDWENPLMVLEAKSLSEITEMLNTVMAHIALGEFP